MIKKNTLNRVVALTMLMLSGIAVAQDAEQAPLYLSVDCMKSTSPAYVNVETEIWQPMHEEMIRRGMQASWALYWVMYGDRSRCDYYTVTTYAGEEQLNSGMPFEEIFEAVHRRKDFDDEMVRTWASRQHVASELWVMVDSTAIQGHRFATVNKMHAEDPDAYMRMETQVFKPGHQVLLERGFRAGWAMYELVSPVGTAIPYNFGTVDFVNHLNPVPMAEAMLTANPDRDIGEMADMLELREQISSETWMLVATTNNAAPE